MIEIDVYMGWIFFLELAIDVHIYSTWHSGTLCATVEYYSDEVIVDLFCL